MTEARKDVSPRIAFALDAGHRYAALVVNLGAVMIIARLLSPEEIGLYAVAAAIVAVAHAFRDAGVPAYMMQEKELTEARIRTAFTVLLLVSWTIALAIVLTRSLVAGIYADSRLEELLLVMALNFVVLPFGVPLIASLHRAMAFGKLFIVHLSAAVAGAYTSVALAWLGYSHMSLAWGSLVTVSLSTLIAYLCHPKPAYFLPRFADMGRVATVANFTMGTNLITAVGSQAPEIIVGRVLGFYSAGIYSRARGEIGLFARQIIAAVLSVSFPLLAAKHRNGERLDGVYLTIVTYVTGLAWPFYAGLAILCLPLTRVMFGDQWDDAVPVVQILCISAAIGAISPIHSNVLTNLGRVKQLFKLELALQSMGILLCLAAAFWGVEYVALTRVFTAALGVALYVRMIGPLIGFEQRRLWRGLWPSAKLLLWSAPGPFLMVQLIGTAYERSALCLIAGSLLLAAGWLAGVYSGAHPLKSELEMLIKARARRQAPHSP